MEIADNMAVTGAGSIAMWCGLAHGLGEELLMRGFVLNRLADVFGRSRMGWSVAVLIHAMFFGLLHVYQGVPGVC